MYHTSGQYDHYAKNFLELSLLQILKLVGKDLIKLMKFANKYMKVEEKESQSAQTNNKKKPAKAKRK